jgi:diguanylate cyclase (GGDEF)-like protein
MRTHLLSRLRNDFRLALLTLFGAVANVGILPFALYRFATGNPVAGLVDLGILACIIGAVVHGWRGGERGLARASTAVVITSTVGCLAVSVLGGLPGALWMYPILIANFFMTAPRVAFAISGVALAFLLLHGGAFSNALQLWSFGASGAVTVLFAYIFAHRSERQRAQLEDLAIRDPLTGLRNRRAMEDELRRAIDASRHDGVPQVLALLDLDHFKRINDECGHDAGDRVLVEFATLLRGLVRRADGLFRFGGEEFVLLLPGAGRDDAARLLAKMRSEVATRLRRSDGVPVTVSIGAAALQPGETWHAWLARADMGLYAAKRGGRDRVVVDGADALEGAAATPGPLLAA